MPNNEKKIISWSGHSKFQLLVRGILEQDVETVVNNPIQTVYDDYEENYKSYGIIEDKYTENRKK